MRVEYHPAVQKELEEIRDYYEDRAPGLGRAFIDEFEGQILRIAATPERWMIVDMDIRRCLMTRFPYVIYFRCVGTDRIRITTVKHQRRHPKWGRDRQ